jgi:hypothetical protein
MTSSADTSQRPILFLDVDGPLNPWAGKPERRPAGYQTFRYRSERNPREKPYRVWLNPSHGERLLSLGYDLVWGTLWHDIANQWISPKIGLPDDLPVVQFPRGTTGHWRRPNTSRKIPHLIAYAAGRPFAWVDDEIGVHDDQLVADQHPAPALLHYISPRLGLREHDFSRLQRWAEHVSTSTSGTVPVGTEK